MRVTQGLGVIWKIKSLKIVCRMKERAKNTELVKREIPMNPATMNGSDRPRVNAILPSFFVSGPDTLVVVSDEEELLEPSYSACCSHQLPSSSEAIFQTQTHSLSGIT